MGLDIPDLDDRRYDELLADAINQLPVHSTEWTDHNAHDPGITILETLAWLAETYTYQLDQVTDAHRRKYLALLDAAPRPPIPATVDLQLRPADGEPAAIPDALEGVKIEAGATLLVEDGSRFSGLFETTKPVTLTRARVDRVVTIHAAGLTDNTTANETNGMQYLAFGDRAERDAAFYLGFDCDPFAAAEEDIIDITVDYDDSDLPPVTSPTGDDAVSFQPSVELAWEHCTNFDEWRSADTWTSFDVVRDQTNQLYRGGTVAIEQTKGWQQAPRAILGLEEAYYWIRCRVKTPGYEIPPPLDAVRMDIVPARHRATMEGERTRLERPDGGTETAVGPGQTFSFPTSPVLDATISVGGELWDAVPDFDGSGPDDRHYVLRATDGEIRFGDGRYGRIPDPGQPVVAETYAYGGGALGNVPRSSACEFVSSDYEDVPVSLRDDAAGGVDAESVDAAIARLRRDLNSSHRAVSLDDYRRLARQTPGVRIARVTALVGRQSTPTGPGPFDVVRVIVVPYSPRSEPQPSQGVLNTVTRHLDRHRLLTDRFRVEPPQYVGITVDATVRLAPGSGERERIRAVEDAIDTFLNPLGTAGDEGWPFGRPVYRSELYATIETVDGVDVVLDVSIDADREVDRDVDGNVLLAPVALPSPKHHRVTVEDSTAERRR